MKTLESDIDIKNLDKSDWKSYKFEKIAKSIGERVEPTKTDLDIYVGLEHLDSDSIHIKRFGKREDVSGTKLRCYPGDVIFGRRRAYQRKAAIVEFDGFCSAHSLVLRANPDVIDHKLFPFFLHSDTFMHRAVDISVGSLSPTINWGTLKNEEFLLPPKDQQARLAELLWAADYSQEGLSKLILSLTQQLNSYIKEVITSSIVKRPNELISAKSPFQTKWIDAQYPKGWKSFKLMDVVSNYQNGFAEGKRDENGIPQLRMNNVTRSGRIDLSSIEMIPNDRNIDRYMIEENDVLFCNTNSEDLVGKSILANSLITGFTFSNHFTRLRPNDELITPKFLHTWLKYHFDIGLFERRCTKWIGQAAIQTENLLSLYIVLPPLDEQIIAEKKVRQLEQAIELAEIRLQISKQLQKSLINQIF